MTSTYIPRHIYCFLALLLWAACCITSCSGSAGQADMTRAEALMEEHPDSALSILETVDKSRFGSEAERARYALLMSMALDKNYIDTTTFDVLRPAIDYYLENGNPDEKLRTYYYQGCIFRNRGDRDNALDSYVKGLENSAGCTDSLCLARAFVAQGLIYKEFYDFDGYTGSSLKAAGIYRKCGRKDLEFDCLLNGWNGTILLKDRHRADSLMGLCCRFEPLDDSQCRRLQGYRLSHVMVFGSLAELKDFIRTQDHDTPYDINGYLNLAFACNKTGDNVFAMQLLREIENIGTDYDTLKYQSISTEVFKDLGDYRSAFSVYWDLTHKLDSINSVKFEQKAKSIEEKHQIELQARDDLRRKDNIIWKCMAGIVFLVLGIVILILSLRSHRNNEDLAVQKARATELENENLKAQKERLDIEKRNLQLENEKKALEMENMGHQMESLKNECESLKAVMNSHEDIPQAAKETIRIRIEMLNSLLARYITDNDRHSEPYEAWLRDMTDNREKFINSNRLAFRASHPRFITYLEEHGLTVGEINYVCLYAIGLNGKEVGNYMKRPGHVNISSAIRRKLGLGKNDTNLNIHILRLLKEL